MRKRAILAALVYLWTLPAHAETVTPNHVLQQAETLRMELLELNEANFSKSTQSHDASGQYETRHVYMLARTVWGKVQLLRYMNGLDTSSLEPIPGRDISVDELHDLVKNTLDDVAEMRLAYGLEGEIAQQSLPSGKTTNDVYASLVQVIDELDALGVPAIAPNDVYQLAYTVRNVLEEIAENSGVRVRHAQRPYWGKTPSDVYDETTELIADVRTLAEQDPGIEIPGGVPAAAARSGPATSQNVAIVLSQALADVIAFKVASGVNTETQYEIYRGGKTPSDVFQVVAQSRALITRLRRAGS